MIVAMDFVVAVDRQDLYCVALDEHADTQDPVDRNQRYNLDI